jgi:hypothetical protein
MKCETQVTWHGKQYRVSRQPGSKEWRFVSVTNSRNTFTMGLDQMVKAGFSNLIEG